jgi:hypothetical protein
LKLEPARALVEVLVIERPSIRYVLRTVDGRLVVEDLVEGQVKRR